VTGFTIPDENVRRIAAQLKSALGTGGSARGGEILVQGDRRNDVLRLLTSFGYRARII
jgi:translation initiation factor 1